MVEFQHIHTVIQNLLAAQFYDFARQRAAAFGKMQIVAGFIGTIDIHGDVANRVQIKYRNAMSFQAVGGRYRTCDGACNLVLDACQGVDEKILAFYFSRDILFSPRGLGVLEKQHYNRIINLGGKMLSIARCAVVCVTLLLFVPPVFAATPAQIDTARNKALAWMLTQQGSDGAWKDAPGTAAVATATALEAFNGLGLKGFPMPKR